MSAREIVRYNLGYKKIISYFVEHIRCGKTLSKKIIEKIDFHNGFFFTFLPKNVSLSKIFDFTEGIIPPIPYGHQLYQIGERSFHPQQIITMHPECSEFIADYIKKNGNYAVVEDYMLESNEAYLKMDNVVMIPYQKEVYYFLDQKSSKPEILKTLKWSGETWHSFCVLSHIENTIPTSLKDKDLDIICDNVKFVIVGAYDGEGYIFWERLPNPKD